MTNWAIILGASSGFGGATAAELARQGLNIFGVHLDRKATMPMVDALKKGIESHGRQAVFFNMNAADRVMRSEAVDQMKELIGPDDQVKILMHSLAFGTLKPVIAENSSDALTQGQVEMTIDVMGSSIVYWTQDLFGAGLLRRGSHIFGMTSAGGHVQWPSYGAVSAAKAVLESWMRQLAFELAPYGITANTIQAGITNTPALRKIPGSEEMLARATAANPNNKLTQPEDVARVIARIGLTDDTWMTGNVIRVDGGEDIAG